MYEPGLINFKLLFHFVTDGENKYFLDFVQRDHPDCNIITMGVGLDYSGETKLWNRYPQCKMTAVDPMSDVNKQIVERVPNSRFIEATIGAHDGNYTARLRQCKFF
jgi:trans-aconitate methyltransferase